MVILLTHSPPQKILPKIPEAVPKLILQDSDLIQLQLLHDNESLQMTRLLKEQEAKLMHKKKLHEKFEAGADTSNEIEGAEDCMLL